MTWLWRVLLLAGGAIGALAGVFLSLMLLLVALSVLSPGGPESEATGYLAFFYPIALVLGPVGWWLGSKLTRTILKQCGVQT